VKTREIIALGFILWLAFYRRPMGITDVVLTITEPGFEGETVSSWPPLY